MNGYQSSSNRRKLLLSYQLLNSRSGSNGLKQWRRLRNPATSQFRNHSLGGRGSSSGLQSVQTSHEHNLPKGCRHCHYQKIQAYIDDMVCSA